MLDLQMLRNDLGAVARRLADRGLVLDTATFERLEASRKAAQVQTQELQARRNQLSKEVGQAKAKKEDASALIAEVNAQADKLKALGVDPVGSTPEELVTHQKQETAKWGKVIREQGIKFE